MPQRSASVYHSLLTPMMNIGLITPEEVLEKALEYGKAKKVPLNSLEGFVRQILGWREFIRGIYRNYSQQQEETNFFGHHRKLTDAWYTGDTGLPPLDIAIRRAKRVGYNHHIERLMVISNTMLLCRVDPKEAHRWFMEMYVDSAEWVMGPNVYGMGQFSDGGIFATKPYICGSNYWLKMSDYPKGDWQDGIDGLYWAFIDRNRAYFAKNPRMATMVRMHDQMPSAKAKRLLLAARDLQAKLTKA
jgi:deoxyribodipyrimidine photolyase-related protein